MSPSSAKRDAADQPPLDLPWAHDPSVPIDQAPTVAHEHPARRVRFRPAERGHAVGEGHRPDENIRLVNPMTFEDQAARIVVA